MKYLNLLFSMLFIFSAYLQLNDVDPLLWVAIYLSGAMLCILAVFKQARTLFLAVALIIYLGYAILLFFAPDGVWSWFMDYHAENITQSMKATKPWIENTREFFGLIILSAVTGANLLQRQHQKNTQSASYQDKQ